MKQTLDKINELCYRFQLINLSINQMNKTYQKSALVILAAIVFLAVAKGASACEFPKCSISTKSGDIVVNFKAPKMLSTSGSVYTYSYSANIPAGNYEVMLESYDGYVGREKVTQPKERYFVKFMNDGKELAKSGSTSDLKDYVQEATWKGTVSGKITLGSKSDQVKTVHSDYVENSSPNSVSGVCMVLRPIIDKIDGKCGSANGQTFESKPTSNLCSSGTASTVLGTNKWIWSCYGKNGGSMVYCEANVQPKKVDGKCGSANGQIFTYKPTSNLCSVGNASTVTGEDQLSWTCSGKDGGADAHCKASIKKEETKPVCGNKIVETGEKCDDGNILNGDGCSSICMTEQKEEEEKDEDEDEDEDDSCDGSIGDYIWLDKDGDGVQDNDESGLSGIHVTLKSDNDEWETRTNKNGKYEFDELCKDEYVVTVKDKDVASYTQTFDPDGNKNNKTDVKLKNDDDSTKKIDFGYKGKALPKTGSGLISLLVAGFASVAGAVVYKRKK